MRNDGILARQRWAAIGAAVAVSLGGGATWVATAAGNSPSAELVTIVPCRIMDTRAGNDNVGPRSTPLRSNDTHVVTVWGTNGRCTIPSTATGIVKNVTVVNATAPSFLTIYPSDADRPLASSLNYVAGQAPTPNGVTVGLSADGKVAFFNREGSADVIADIVGYYTAGTPGPTGPQGPAGPTGPQGPVGPLPTVGVASLTACCYSLSNTAIGEANAKQVLIKGSRSPGSYLVRVDAQLNNFGALWFDYHCKLQALQYPYFIGIGGSVPWSDLPATRREVSWRTGKDNAGNTTTSTGVSISMQAPVTAGDLGLDVRMVCWGTVDTSGPLYDYGLGVESAVLTLEPVGGIV